MLSKILYISVWVGLNNIMAVVSIFSRHQIGSGRLIHGGDYVISRTTKKGGRSYTHVYESVLKRGFGCF